MTYSVENDRIELEVPGGKRFINIDLMPLLTRAKVFIFNNHCNKYATFTVDLSGQNGEVSAYRRPEDSNTPYQLPKWVRAIIKKELEKTL